MVCNCISSRQHPLFEIFTQSIDSFYDHFNDIFCISSVSSISSNFSLSSFGFLLSEPTSGVSPVIFIICRFTHITIIATLQCHVLHSALTLNWQKVYLEITFQIHNLEFKCIYESPTVPNIKGVFLPDLFRHEDNPLYRGENIPVFISFSREREQR